MHVMPILCIIHCVVTCSIVLSAKVILQCLAVCISPSSRSRTIHTHVHMCTHKQHIVGMKCIQELRIGTRYDPLICSINTYTVKREVTKLGSICWTFNIVMDMLPPFPMCTFNIATTAASCAHIMVG